MSEELACNQIIDPQSRLSPMSKINELYRLNDRPDVERFLKDNRQLVPLLIEGYSHLRDHFGSDVIATLQVNQDPEDELEQLVVLVRSGMTPREAAHAMYRFISDWWVSVSDRSESQMVFLNAPC